VKGHAIVIGASSGIGAAVAKEATARGYSVSALSRRPARPGAVARSIPCDVTDDAKLGAALDRALSEGGDPAALVYCAGAPVVGKTLAVPEAVARDAFEVNFWGLERAVRRVYPRMRDRGEGSIVALLSIAGLRAVPYEAHYGASKAAAARWLDCLALEAERERIRVAYLAPGYVPTGFLERSGWHGLSPESVAGSGVTPEDVARAALDLVDGHRTSAVLGWRENAITLADRLLPGAYDRVLARRMRRSR
jgi:short-subunit dehydrogenase